MLTQIQVIGLETGDSVPALLVVTERHRYLFNVGEGLQRFCMEHKLRLSRVDGIFLSRVCADTCGGLPGLILTVADMGKTSMRVYGGPGLADLLFGFRNFMRRDDVALHAVQVRGTEEDGRADMSDEGAAAARVASTSGLAAVEFGDLTVTPVLLDPAAAAAIVGHAAPRPLGDTHGALREALAHPQLNASAPIPLCGGGGGSSSRSRPGSAGASRNERPDVSWYPKTDSEGGSGSKKGGNGSEQGLPSPVPASRRTYSAPFNPFDVSWWPTAAQGWGAGSEGEEDGPVPLAMALSDPETPSLPSRPSPPPSLSFLLRTEDIPGTFDAAKARMLGIPTGPALGTLSKGLPVLVERPLSALQALVAAGTVAESDVLNAEAAAALAASGVAWVKGGAPNAKAAKKAATKAAAAAGAAEAASVSSEPAAPPEPAASLLVQPGWLKGPDTPGLIVGIVDAPTLSHAAVAVAHEAWAPFYAPSSPSAGLQALYHFSPPEVTASPAYQAWMRRFGPFTQHIMLVPPSAGSGSEAAASMPLMYYSQAAQIMKLHALHPRAFPLPHPVPAMLAAGGKLQGGNVDVSQALRALLQSLPATSPSSAPALQPVPQRLSAAPSSASDACGPLIPVTPLLTHRLIPLAQAGFYTEGAARAEQLLDPVAVMQQLASDETLRGMLAPGAPLPAAAPAPPAGSAGSAGSMPADARVLFTGTASAIPSKYRNVSGIVLFPRPAGGAGGVVMDCGEGTWGQLVRALASQDGAGCYCSLDAAAVAALTGLRMIWISHMHADHHLGIARLLTERSKLAPAVEPMLIVGPTRLYLWLLEATSVDTRLQGRWRFVDAEHFRVGPTAPPASLRGAFAPPRFAMGGTSAAAVPAAAVVVAAESETQEEGSSAAAGDAADAPSPKRMRMSDDADAAAGPTCAAPSSMSTIELPSFDAPVPEPQLAHFWESFHTRLHPVIMPVPAAAASPPPSPYLADAAFVASAFAAVGIAALRTVRVQHCHKAYAVRLEMAADERCGGWAVVYSGDTRPTWEVAALTAGQVSPPSLWNGSACVPTPPEDLPLAALSSSGPLQGTASVLIHEATFEDTADDRAHAIEKNHSTAQEAGLVAEAAGVPTLILTHFSARYPKLPVLKPAKPLGASSGLSTLVAYDLMSVWGADVPALPQLLPALHRIFAEPAEAEA